jgi:hypothetical protein
MADLLLKGFYILNWLELFAMLPSAYLYKLVGSAGRMQGATFCFEAVWQL